MKMRYAIAVVATATVLVLAGCTNQEEGPVATAPSADDIQPDETAIGLLPNEVEEAGVLRIGGDLAGPPKEFKDSNGNPAGWGISLAYAISAKLGLEPDFEILGFDSILPRIEEGAVDMGAASFTDTVERQKTVDFVNYLMAGTQWAAAIGNEVDPDDSCGLTIAVAQGTLQHSEELPERSDDCVAAGKEAITILPFATAPEVVEAVVQGRADALSMDSTTTGDAIKQRPDEIHAVGDLFAAAPYGFATQKGSGTTKAVQAALQSLIDDGTYLKMLTDAGVEDGALPEATINAGRE